MTDSVHPTPDELGDLHADLLSGPESDRVRSHLEGCASCTAELAAVDDVAAILAEAGGEALAMPADVAAVLDDALEQAGRERAAGVPSLAAKREEVSQRTSRRRPWVLIGGAAAAAVVVLGSVGLSGLDGLTGDSGGDSDSSAGSAADSGDAVRGESQTELDAPDEGGGSANGDTDYSKSLPRLTEASLPGFATKLVAEGNKPQTVRSSTTCVQDLPAQPSTPVAYADVMWDGSPAVIVVDSTARTATVFGCGMGVEPLYSTSY